jgi:hypothetical protein
LLSPPIGLDLARKPAAFEAGELMKVAALFAGFLRESRRTTSRAPPTAKP